MGLTRSVVEGGRRAKDRETDRQMEEHAAPRQRSGQVLEGIEVEGHVEEPLQLCQVGFLIAGGRGSCWLPPCIPAGEKVGHEKGLYRPTPSQPPSHPLHPYQTGLARLMVVRSRGLT